MSIFHLQRPTKIRHPVVISAPHVGIEFPPEVRDAFIPEILSFPVDADWHVHELYRDIARELGLILIWPKFSRYVVDLNRDPAGGRLYQDSRKETSVVPTVTFAGKPLYKQGREPNEEEINRRVATYHAPYYNKVTELINELRQNHDHVLFYDAHSIKRLVPSIHSEPFPDMILGTNSGQSASENLVLTALDALRKSNFDVRRDEIFRGGHLTRFFGQPSNGVHALQLERCWDTYLADDPRQIDKIKASEMKSVLKEIFVALARTLSSLPKDDS